MIDFWYKTTDKDSFKYARQFLSNEGLLIGGSSGNALNAQVEYVKEHPELTEKDVIVLIFPYSIRSYLSKLIDNNWLTDNGLWDDDILTHDK